MNEIKDDAMLARENCFRKAYVLLNEAYVLLKRVEDDDVLYEKEGLGIAPKDDNGEAVKSLHALIKLTFQNYSKQTNLNQRECFE